MTTADDIEYILKYYSMQYNRRVLYNYTTIGYIDDMPSIWCELWDGTDATNLNSFYSRLYLIYSKTFYEYYDALY